MSPYYITHNTRYWVVKNSAGDTLFASEDKFSSEDYILLLELQESQGYQDWLMRQDAKFLEEV